MAKRMSSSVTVTDNLDRWLADWWGSGGRSVPPEPIVCPLCERTVDHLVVDDEGFGCEDCLQLSAEPLE